MKVAVVGATGAVGREMTRTLEEREFPVDELLPLASSRSAGTTVSFRGADHEVRELSIDALRGVDLALVSAGAAVSKAFIPEAAANGTVCIDNSSAFRMDPDVPLSIPEVNPEALVGDPRVIAVPNCTTITAMLAVAPLHRRAGLTSMVLTSYQSVSGAGHTGVSELLDQVDKLRGDEASLAHPVHGSLPTGPVFGKTMAYNVVAKIGEFESDGFTGEEAKMMAEPRKILGLPDLPVVATSVRVPVLAGHGASILAEFSEPISVGDAREALEGAPGVVGPVVVAAGLRGPRRRVGGPDPSGARTPRRPGPLQLRRQPSEGRSAQRGPDRRAPVRPVRRDCTFCGIVLWDRRRAGAGRVPFPRAVVPRWDGKPLIPNWPTLLGDPAAVSDMGARLRVGMP